jgi:lipopolysaccharide exporter
MARGVVWLGLLTTVDRTLGLLSTLILARLLVPADFGVVAMALSFIFLAQLLSAFGFDVALIHRQDATEDHYHTAWTFNALLGLAITLVSLAAAGPIARFYHQPAVFWVTCALALGPLIGGCENIGVVAFRKDLEFRKEFAFQLSRRLVGFAVTVPLAISLRSYWALVAGTLAARLAGTISSYRVHPFRPRLSLSQASSLLHFSKWLLFNNVLGLLKERMSDFILGRLAGPAALGVYNVSYEFSNLPTTEIGAPVNRALLPGFAKFTDASAVLAAYSNAMSLVALVAIPAAAGLFAISHFFIPVVLGERWIDGVPLMQVLAVSSAVLVFQASVACILIARGYPDSTCWTNAVFVVLLAMVMIILVPRFGALGAAWAALFTTTSTMPLYLYQLRRRVGMPMRTFLRALVRPSVSSVLMVLVVRGMLPAYSPAMPTATAAFWLSGTVLSGAIAYAAFELLLWIAAGRPAGVERLILDQIRIGRASWLAQRRSEAQ